MSGRESGSNQFRGQQSGFGKRIHYRDADIFERGDLLRAALRIAFRSGDGCDGEQRLVVGACGTCLLPGLNQRCGGIGGRAKTTRTCGCAPSPAIS